MQKLGSLSYVRAKRLPWVLNHWLGSISWFSCPAVLRPSLLEISLLDWAFSMAWTHLLLGGANCSFLRTASMCSQSQFDSEESIIFAASGRVHGSLIHFLFAYLSTVLSRCSGLKVASAQLLLVSARCPSSLGQRIAVKHPNMEGAQHFPKYCSGVLRGNPAPRSPHPHAARRFGHLPAPPQAPPPQHVRFAEGLMTRAMPPGGPVHLDDDIPDEDIRSALLNAGQRSTGSGEATAPGPADVCSPTEEPPLDETPLQPYKEPGQQRVPPDSAGSGGVDQPRQRYIPAPSSGDYTPCNGVQRYRSEYEAMTKTQFLHWHRKNYFKNGGLGWTCMDQSPPPSTGRGQEADWAAAAQSAWRCRLDDPWADFYVDTFSELRLFVETARFKVVEWEGRRDGHADLPRDCSDRGARYDEARRALRGCLSGGQRASPY